VAHKEQQHPGGKALREGRPHRSPVLGACHGVEFAQVFHPAQRYLFSFPKFSPYGVVTSWRPPACLEMADPREGFSIPYGCNKPGRPPSPHNKEDPLRSLNVEPLHQLVPLILNLRLTPVLYGYLLWERWRQSSWMCGEALDAAAGPSFPKSWSCILCTRASPLSTTALISGSTISTAPASRTSRGPLHTKQELRYAIDPHQRND
jgi:hypothetical protein